MDKNGKRSTSRKRRKSLEDKKKGKKEKVEEPKMAVSLEEQYKAILHPTKNAEEAFSVNLAEQLESYLQAFLRGETDTNFNSAALVIQGSSNLYSKKVEYLYSLTASLHELLTKANGKGEPKKNPKEKAQRQSKTIDPFCSTEIKVGKNLSCLRRKNVAKASAAKKSSKKAPEKKHAFVPVDLLPLECEEKGDVFYDTRGEVIGNKNDYTLNKCRITNSGWLLLPTVSTDNVPQNEDHSSLSDDCSGGSPLDEGYPASSGCPSSPPTAPSSQALFSSQVPSSQQTDEGLGSLGCTPSDGTLSQPLSSQETPMEDDDNDAAPDVDMENIPLESFPTDEEFVLASKPQRRSIRNALQQIQKQAEQKRQNSPKEDLFATRRPIEKNNTVCYPPGMRSNKPKTRAIYPASVYCARTFFSVESTLKKKDMFSMFVSAFANNTKFVNNIKSYKEAIKAAKSKRKASQGEVVSADEEDEVDIEDVQEPTDDEEDHSFAAHPGPIDDDFDNDDDLLGGMDSIAKRKPNGVAEPSEDDDMDAGYEFDKDDEYDRNTEEQIALFRDDIQTVEQTAQMTQRVRKWEKILKPFLEEVKQREKFDINQYGQNILDSFEESNRRQTILFRNFCEGKEKYEIHRYFMALLPLANVGNVTIANEPNEDGSGNDIAITLLSRRMHHMELEEFGHNEGQHN